MSVPVSLFLLEIVISVKPNTVHKINLGQTYLPPVLKCLIPAAPSSGRAALVAVAERPHIGWRVRQYGRFSVHCVYLQWKYPFCQ
jgi:hypothetical protein